MKGYVEWHVGISFSHALQFTALNLDVWETQIVDCHCPQGGGTRVVAEVAGRHLGPHGDGVPGQVHWVWRGPVHWWGHARETPKVRMGPIFKEMLQDLTLQVLENTYKILNTMLLMWPCTLQSDRLKAQKAMEGTWSTMEKKEKIMWIKKAAEDQKRYEVSDSSIAMFPRAPQHLYKVTGGANRWLDSHVPQQRDLCEMRSPAAAIASGKKMKFEGEPKKPPS